jgi:hypothetical protein
MVKEGKGRKKGRKKKSQASNHTEEKQDLNHTIYSHSEK